MQFFADWRPCLGHGHGSACIDNAESKGVTHPVACAVAEPAGVVRVLRWQSIGIGSSDKTVAKFSRSSGDDSIEAAIAITVAQAILLGGTNQNVLQIPSCQAWIGLQHQRDNAAHHGCCS